MTLSEEQYQLMVSAHDLFTNVEFVREYQSRSGRNMKDITDKYHTMEVLYEHRRKMFAIITSVFKRFAWKSRTHSDGEVWDGLFIVGVSIPNVGDYSYHYHTEFWDEFDVKELVYAPEYDGHKPEDIDRLFELLLLIKEVVYKDGV